MMNFVKLNSLKYLLAFLIILGGLYFVNIKPALAVTCSDGSSSCGTTGIYNPGNYGVSSCSMSGSASQGGQTCYSWDSTYSSGDGLSYTKQQGYVPSSDIYNDPNYHIAFYSGMPGYLFFHNVDDRGSASVSGLSASYGGCTCSYTDQSGSGCGGNGATTVSGTLNPGDGVNLTVTNVCAPNGYGTWGGGAAEAQITSTLYCYSSAMTTYLGGANAGRDYVPDPNDHNRCVWDNAPAPTPPTGSITVSVGGVVQATADQNSPSASASLAYNTAYTVTYRSNADGRVCSSNRTNNSTDNSSVTANYGQTVDCGAGGSLTLTMQVTVAAGCPNPPSISWTSGYDSGTGTYVGPYAGAGQYLVVNGNYFGASPVESGLGFESNYAQGGGDIGDQMNISLASAVAGNSYTISITNGNANCAAATASVTILNKPVAGACGSANGKIYANGTTSFGSDTFCSPGTVMSVPAFPSAGNSVTWGCSGLYSGTDTASNACSASQANAVQPGVCGTANNIHYAQGSSSYSPYNQCSSGNVINSSSPAFPALGGTTTWQCSGSGGGADSPTCQAWQKQDGVGGTACNNTYPIGTTSYGSDTFCASGTASPASPAFPTVGSPVSWTCSGSGGGATASCTATRSNVIPGTCGSANTMVYANGSSSYAPYLQCGSGSSSNTAFPTAGNSVTWTCLGSGGGANSGTCSASQQGSSRVDGVCASPPNGSSYSSTPSGPYCSAGSASTVSGSGPWTWSCTGSGGGNTASCSASVAVVNGCGSANGSSSASAPSSNLCSAGYSSSVVGLSGSVWSWTCTQGANSNSCYATKPGGGASCGSCSVTSNTVNSLCSAGYPIGPFKSGSVWYWVCVDSTNANNQQWCPFSGGIPVGAPFCSLPAGSDLTVTDFHYTDVTGTTKTIFAQGEKIYPSVTIKNQGTSPAFAYYSNINYPTAPFIIPLPIVPNYFGTFVYDSSLATGTSIIYETGVIAAGASKTYSVTSNSSAWANISGVGYGPNYWTATSTGVHTATATVDYLNYVNDVNKNNNALAANYTISGGPPPSAPASLSVTTGTSCGTTTSTWPSVVGATSYNLYRNTVNSTSTATKIASVTSPKADTGLAAGSYYYWVTAVNAGGESAYTPATSNSTSGIAATSCNANLLDSDKDIVAINGVPVSPAPVQCNGSDALPNSTNISLGDKLKFQINLCNDQGHSPASLIKVRDNMINLTKPSAGWNVQYNGSALTFDSAQSNTSSTPCTPTGSGHYCSYGSAPNQGLVIDISGSGNNIVATGTGKITFEAVTSLPTGFVGTVARFQNGFTINYNNSVASDTASGNTPLLPFYVGSGSPIIQEVP